MSKRLVEISFEVKGHATVTIKMDEKCNLDAETILQKLKNGEMTLSIVKGEELNDQEGKFYGKTILTNPEGLEYSSFMLENEFSV